MAGENLRAPLFCTGDPVWEQASLAPTCNSDWPIRVQFYDGSKDVNGNLKTCTIDMSESKASQKTTNCLGKVLNGFDSSKVEKLDWIVYITAGYNARILWYHDFAEVLIQR